MRRGVMVTRATKNEENMRERQLLPLKNCIGRVHKIIYLHIN